MPRTIIAEGKTTTEAIANGLKELNVSKDKVDIKILEEHEKRSFFSILAPRVVKVELTLKEEKKNDSKKKSENVLHNKLDEQELVNSKEKVEKFLKEFISNFKNLEFTTSIDFENDLLKVDIDGESSKMLIGYRGEVLNALQNILNSIANRESNARVRVILNISNYKQKREKSLEELAEKIAKTVLKTGKSIKLEPMMAYERKIIHSKLQSNNKVTTYSIGEEPHRRVVIEKNNN